MATLNQLNRKPRVKSKNYCRTKFLRRNPQKRGICVRVYTTKPKKPHSAIRKIAKVYIPSVRRYTLAYIPGQGHNLSVHSNVLLKGGRVRDIPGMHCKIMRNKLDFTGAEVFERHHRRSKYGLKNFLKRKI